MPVVYGDLNDGIGTWHDGQAWVTRNTPVVGIPSRERLLTGAGARVRQLMETQFMCAANTFRGTGPEPTFFGMTGSSRIDYVFVPQ
eukprot:4726982-Pyramimonas_sp.AAC.1